MKLMISQFFRTVDMKERKVSGMNVCRYNLIFLSFNTPCWIFDKHIRAFFISPETMRFDAVLRFKLSRYSKRSS